MKNVSVIELRKFGFIMAAFICLLFGLLFPWVFGKAIDLTKWPWMLALCFVVPAIVYPVVLKPIYHAWMKFGHVMGWINTRLILGAVFFLVFFPMGLVMRLFGKDPLKTRLDHSKSTYRVERQNTIKPEDMEKPY